mmetsp:Transcript_29103/g.48433  ORF Transcript_29103/g.48433 Transcript_29103/m.48433 type:complete len:617 (-) Transcript_29103:145-1995(-)
MTDNNSESCEKNKYIQIPSMQTNRTSFFGQSFNNLMAEAMLEEEYKSSHIMDCDGLADSFQETKNEDGDSGKKKPAPSALKIKTENNTNGQDTSSTGERKGEARSVQIQVPPKRQKIQGNYSAVDIVQALNRALSTEERVDALEAAIATFDHDNRDRHDHEIAVGADIAIVKTLVFLEFKSQFRREPIQADMEAITREIGLALNALECVYRASSESVGESFSRVGTDLMHILVILIDDEVKNRLRAFSPHSSPTGGSYNRNEVEDDDKDGNQSLEDNDSMDDRKRPVTPPSPHGGSVGFIHDRDIMLRKATKCIGHFARVGKATKPLAHFPGFIGTTLALINVRPYNAIPFESRLSCLWTIANLACNTENMSMMMCTPNLINSLVSISCRRAEAGDSLETIMEILRAKSIASRALLNLSWSPSNKVLMCQNFALVETLSNLAMERRAPYRKSHTMQDIMLHTRRNSLGALRNMAAAPRRSKIALCGYNNGKLLDTLTDVALNETDQSAIDLSFAAIHNLAIHDTAELIVDRPALVLALKNVLLEDEDDDSEEEPKNSRKSHASSTILVLERTITPDMESYDNLRELLDAVNPSNTVDEDEDEDDMMPSEAVNATAV